MKAAVLFQADGAPVFLYQIGLYDVEVLCRTFFVSASLKSLRRYAPECFLDEGRPGTARSLRAFI